MARVRAVLADAKPRDTLESSVMRHWGGYAIAAEQLSAPALDPSPRARMQREILRIAQTHQWQGAIAHFLDTRGVAYMSDLSDPQLEDLHDRMLGYLDAAETGCDSIDSLPAR